MMNENKSFIILLALALVALACLVAIRLLG